MDQCKVAFLLPCFNEALSVQSVIQKIKKTVPNSAVYVYDNNSTDNTMALAQDAGAIVRSVTPQGKGHVVRKMFADINADVFILLDGDGTYDIDSAPEMIRLLMSGSYDMVVGRRVEVDDKNDRLTYRKGHRLGNRLFNTFVSCCFSEKYCDLFSGYRVMSKRFVKSFYGESNGFEIETELTIHSWDLRLSICEYDTPYFPRKEGSNSKLNTVRDGFKILFHIIYLFKSSRPFLFFSLVSLGFILISLLLFYPVLATFIKTGMVPRLPTAILSGLIAIVSVISFVTGIVMSGLSRSFRALKQFIYLSIPFESSKEDKL